MKLIITDGGRKAAGFTRKTTSDCVARSVAIASGRDYREVHNYLTLSKGAQRTGKYPSGTPTADHGIRVQRKWFKDYMRELGFVWTPTMGIGTGCRVHLKAGEIPMEGRLVVALSRHYTAVIDGVIHDVYNPSRRGRRCVYGYWRLA